MDCNCLTNLDILAAILDVMSNLKANLPRDFLPLAKEIENSLHRQQMRLEERHERICLAPKQPGVIGGVPMLPQERTRR